MKAYSTQVASIRKVGLNTPITVCPIGCMRIKPIGHTVSSRRIHQCSGDYGQSPLKSAHKVIRVVASTVNLPLPKFAEPGTTIISEAGKDAF